MAQVACPHQQTQPRTLKLAYGNGLGALMNGPPRHIRAVLQPTRNCSSPCLWQPGAIVEHLSVVGSGLTSVSLQSFEFPLNKEASHFLPHPHPISKIQLSNIINTPMFLSYMSTKKFPGQQ